MSDLLNAKELGAKLRVDGKTITKWANEGIIPAEVKEGRLYRFDEEKVREALRERAGKRNSV